MKKGKAYKIIIAVAVIVTLLTGTVFAVSSLLSPSRVAQQLGEDAVANAFLSDDAVIVNESIETGDYIITLLGTVSGKGLENSDIDVEAERSYAVVSIEHADGHAFDSADMNPFTLSPVIDGYEPWKMSIFNLNAYMLDTTVDGIRYCLIATDSLEIFADHTVHIAAFDGVAPSKEIFVLDANGAVCYNDSYSGIRAMFELPLDKSKADPEAAAELAANREAEAQSSAYADNSADEIDSDLASDATMIKYIIYNEKGKQYSIVIDADGTKHIYDSEGNEIPADAVPGISVLESENTVPTTAASAN